MHAKVLPPISSIGEPVAPSPTPTRSAARAESYSDLQERLRLSNAFDESKKDAIAVDVVKLNARLDSMKKEMRFLVNPNSKWMQYWDLVTLSALLFTLTITPYEVALLPTTIDPLLFINQAINVIFITDIMVNLFLPYRESVYKGAGVVRSHWRIFLRYLKSWLLLDVVSVLPFDVLVAAEVFGGADSDFDPTVLRMIRLIRLARLLKLWSHSVFVPGGHFNGRSFRMELFALLAAQDESNEDMLRAFRMAMDKIRNFRTINHVWYRFYDQAQVSNSVASQRPLLLDPGK